MGTLGTFLLILYTGCIAPVAAIGAPLALCYTRQGSPLWIAIIALLVALFVGWYIVVMPVLIMGE